MVCRKLIQRAFAAALLIAALPSFGQVLPETGANVHEGVASCATSVCHGKVSEDPESTVLLNEYRVWLRQDYHSRAYRTLLTDQSRAIARKMGLSSAQGAKVCLDCHADNVPGEARGRRFQVSDGVGCEACHGGSGQWLESHAEATTSHDDNLAKGMYPTEQPIARARLCLSCHMGTGNKLATHEIMGAGHPRLAFELETFTVNQPAHYVVDADYRERKPTIDSVNMWLAGLVIGAKQGVELLQEAWFTEQTLAPELAFYQCHACHHPMDDLRWQPEGGSQALPPGAIRLNDASMVVLASVLDATDPGKATQLRSQIYALHQASLRSRAAVVEQARQLQSTLGGLESSLVNANYGAGDMRKLRRALLADAAAGQYRHFTAAEQAFLAVETLCIALSESEKYQTRMDAWFKTVDTENDFVPAQYSVLARQLMDNL